MALASRILSRSRQLSITPVVMRHELFTPVRTIAKEPTPPAKPTLKGDGIVVILDVILALDHLSQTNVQAKGRFISEPQRIKYTIEQRTREIPDASSIFVGITRDTRIKSGLLDELGAETMMMEALEKVEKEIKKPLLRLGINKEDLPKYEEDLELKIAKAELQELKKDALEAMEAQSKSPVNVSLDAVTPKTSAEAEFTVGACLGCAFGHGDVGNFGSRYAPIECANVMRIDTPGNSHYAEQVKDLSASIKNSLSSLSVNTLLVSGFFVCSPYYSNTSLRATTPMLICSSFFSLWLQLLLSGSTLNCSNNFPRLFFKFQQSSTSNSSSNSSTSSSLVPATAQLPYSQSSFIFSTSLFQKHQHSYPLIQLSEAVAMAFSKLHDFLQLGYLSMQEITTAPNYPCC
ncbi:hypothetical protein HPP92_010897 [Vanilla planifolia]|uniref:Uncharacterized protein n=1 Tax=Vanilla planifolia TaxID=51239 RepID=A0A835UXY9_VANPL|nr:hypothetical protein HPP92_010897 [Vanilla planifolia]